MLCCLKSCILPRCWFIRPPPANIPRRALSFGDGPAFCTGNLSGYKKKPGNAKDSRFFGVLLLRLTKAASLHNTRCLTKGFLLPSANQIQ